MWNQNLDHVILNSLFWNTKTFSPLLFNGLYPHIMSISEPVKLLSHVRLFAIPWTVAYQSPPPMEFSRQEYWSGLPFPTPGDLPDPEMEPRSPTLQADALSPELPGKQFSSTFYGYMVDFQKKMCIIITTIIIVRSIIIIISIISLTKWNVPGINSQTILWKEMKGRHL